VVVAASAVSALASCYSTTDSIGYNGPGGIHLQPLPRLMSYPNPLHDLGKSDADIADKLAETFRRLFHGDPNLQAIYFPMDPDQANIQDILHNHEPRTEGMGLGMMIAVEMDKRDEFDRLWTYAKAMLEQKEGPRRGYFQSSCDKPDATTMACDDPYGMSQMATALIFAHGRWRSDSGPVDYEKGAVELLTVMRHKQDENGGIVGGVTDVFDAESGLPFTNPTAVSDDVGRPSIVMPAYYTLWAKATGDPFWERAADRARKYWKDSADQLTGLTPVRAMFDGRPVEGWDTFRSESFRAQINMALDRIWDTAGKADDDWLDEEADKLLMFFSSQTMSGTSYMLDGTVIDPQPDIALIVVNGVTAMVARTLDRPTYIERVWDLATPTGAARYYSGILDLTALLMLSGQYRIW